MKKKIKKLRPVPRVISYGEGLGVCVVGQIPALGYTVGQMIDRLSQYPRETLLGFNIGPNTNLELLSMYQATEPPGAVWLDLADKESSQ